MGTNFLNWAWHTQHVQTEVTNNEYLSSEQTLLLAGPPRLSHLTTGTAGTAATELAQISDHSNQLFPIGMVSNFGMPQGRNIRDLFEIGSARRYLIPEKIQNSIRMARVKYYGPSLLRVLYAYYPTSRLPGSGAFAAALRDSDVDALNLILPAASGDGVPGYGDPNADVVGENFGQAQDSIKNNRDFWINLQSIIFRQPIGLGLYMKTSADRPYGSVYLEELLVGSHTLGFDADQIVMQEAIDGKFDRLVPIKIASTS